MLEIGLKSERERERYDGPEKERKRAECCEKKNEQGTEAHTLVPNTVWYLIGTELGHFKDTDSLSEYQDMAPINDNPQYILTVPPLWQIQYSVIRSASFAFNIGGIPEI